MRLSADWIAVDWGTSCLRAWAMQGDTVLAQARSDKGMSQLDRESFQPALMELVAPWLEQTNTPVFACGMVGARQGWVEAPYNTVPCHPIPVHPVRVPGTDSRLSVFVVPGLRQLEPADVMRGEECQIAGFLANNPNWDGVICMPGTHTKWVQISAEEVVSFRTFMTGELFDLLGHQSVLRHSLSEGWDDAAFDDAVDQTLSRPETLAARLFGLRAQDLLQGTPGAETRARLSGLLIGAELAAARPYWLGQNIALVGNSGMAKTYARALQRQGVPTSVHCADAMVLSGLNKARMRLEEMT